MILRLTARSIVVASATAIFGIFLYYYGIEPLGLTMLTTVLLETTERVKLEGNLEPGFRAGRYHDIQANGADLRGLHFDYNSRGLTLYIGRRIIPNEGIAVIVDQDLPLFIQKDASAGHEALNYHVNVARVPMVTADHVELRGMYALVRAAWKEQKEEGRWRLKLRSAPGETGKAEIVIPDFLPVFSETSLPFAIPMIVSVVSTSDRPRDFRICLEGASSDPRVYLAPSDPRASSSSSARDSLLELDLSGGGVDLIAYPDMKPTTDSSTSKEASDCRYSRSPWLNLNEDERMKRYRSELSATGALETILTMYR